MHILINNIRNLITFCINVDVHEMLLLQKKKGQGINTVIVIPHCNSLMSVTHLVFLSILLNNFRNLVIFCMNADIDKMLLLWNCFIIFWTELLFLSTITLRRVSDKQCLFTFIYCHLYIPYMGRIIMTSIVRWGGQDTIPGLSCTHPYSHHPAFCLDKILMVMVGTGDTECETY